MVATEWSCVCGRLNKPAWSVCPSCEHRRGAAPTPPKARSVRVQRLLSALLLGLVAVATFALVRPLADRLDGDNDAVPPFTTVERLNGRDPAPANEAARYAALGRRIIAPGRGFLPSAAVVPGPLTPEAVAASDDGGATPAELRAAGLVRGFTAAFESRGRVLVVVVHEFASADASGARVDAQIAALRASYGARPREVPPQLPGAKGIASDGPVAGGTHAVAVVTTGGPRLATVTLLTEDRPDSDDITDLLRYVNRLDAAL
jgi:hypothetical protein